MTGYRQRGASLLELMIALALGALVIGAIVTIYIHVARAAQYQQALTEVQSTGRFATQLIADDIRRAGFWGKVWQPSFEGTFEADDDNFQQAARAGYGGDAQLAQPLPAWGAPTAEVCQHSGCINSLWSGDPQAPHDVLFVRYAKVDGASSVGLESHGSCAWIGTGSGGACSNLDDDDQWQYHAVYYYLRSVQETQSDGGALNVPALYMAQLGATGQYRTVEIVRNVEALAIDWGYDQDGDGFADHYYSSEEAVLQAQSDLLGWWQNVISARVYLVIRSDALAVPRQIGESTLMLGGQTYSAPADNRIRRLFSTTVMIRNARNHSD
ncbi:PilW family protein [Phytohalomonas tamaricis]|uniref:PilW family protein n=1 Tax=Phytohalomonas tamaricis TaxID=2081032 RepID=UPI000D0B05E6|nr:PilW family protein [Phytohalomonas tamaricis]